jgi:hypothetical protein
MVFESSGYDKLVQTNATVQEIDCPLSGRADKGFE